MNVTLGERVVGQPIQAIHLNGMRSEEAKALGVDLLVEERIKKASTVLAAVEAGYPDQVASVASLFDLEMRINRFNATQGVPLRRGIVSAMTRYLMDDTMQIYHHGRIDRNYSPDARDEVLHTILENPEIFPLRIQHAMEQNALRRTPAASAYVEGRGLRAPDEMYQRYGVDVTHGHPRAGLYLPFQEGPIGYDASCVEVGVPIEGMISYLAQAREYRDIAYELYGLDEQRKRGTHFFETPVLAGAMDGHFVVKAHGQDSDSVLGIQFDNPRLLAALSFGTVACSQEALHDIPHLNSGIYERIAALPRADRAQMAYSL